MELIHHCSTQCTYPLLLFIEYFPGALLLPLRIDLHSALNYPDQLVRLGAKLMPIRNLEGKLFFIGNLHHQLFLPAHGIAVQSDAIGLGLEALLTYLSDDCVLAVMVSTLLVLSLN